MNLTRQLAKLKEESWMRRCNCSYIECTLKDMKEPLKDLDTKDKSRSRSWRKLGKK